MNRKVLPLLMSAGMVAAIFQTLSGSEAVRMPESYPLVCRGAATFETNPGPVLWPGCPVIDQSICKYAGFTFRPGSKAARDGLAPGECSWLDRGMREGEANGVVQRIEPVGEVEKYNWIKDLHSPDSYWIFNVYSYVGVLVATGAERNGMTVVSDRGRFPGGDPEIKRPDFYIAEVKVVDLPAGKARLAVRVGNRGTADAGEVILDLRRMRVCRDHQIPRSYRQMPVPALRAGQEQWIYLDDFQREWGTYITREGKDGSRLELVINPSDLYPDCTSTSPVINYVKTERERANNSLLFDPKAP